MARVYTSSVFEGQDKGWEGEDVGLARKRLVVVVPPISHGLAWYGAKKAGVQLEDLDKIEARYSDTVADSSLGSVMLLSEANNGVDDAARTDEEFRAEGNARLNQAVANIATLASMGTAAKALAPAHKESLDVGMPIIFPGSAIVTPGEVVAEIQPL
jgi:hypothetical protein